MKGINQAVEEYTEQLKSGRIREAYRGIMSFMSGLKGAVAKLQPAPKEKTEPVHSESGDTGSVFW